MGGSELLREVLVWVTAGVGLVGLMAWAGRRGSSVLRHALWVLALALFWFLPAAVFAGHELPIGVLSSSTSYEALGPASSVEPAAAQSAPAVTEVSEHTSATTPMAPATTSPGALTKPARGLVWPVLSLWAGLALLWGLGVVFELLRGGRDLLALRRLRRTARPIAEATVDTRVAAWAKHVGLHLLPVVRSCPELTVPGVIGWRRPWLLLPPSFDVTEPGSAAILIHELAHLKGRHPLLQVVARVTRALWWWHPLAWLVERHVRVTAEEVCDDWVVALTRQPEVYARHLVRWAELGQLRGAVAYAHRGRLLVGRVKRVLAQTQPPEVRLSPRVRLSLVLGMIVLLSTAVLLRAAPPAPALRVVLQTRTTSEAQWKELARVLQARVVGYGLPKPVVQKQSGERITVDIPDTKPDPALQANLKSLLTTPGKLELRSIPKRYAYGTNHPPRHDKDNYTFTLDDPQARPVPTAKVLAASSLVASSSEVKRDSRVMDQPGQQVQVEFELTKAGSSRLKSFTESHLNTFLAITLDGKLLMCPLIKSPLQGKGVIQGGFDSPEGKEQARQLSLWVNSGPLPVPVGWGEAAGGAASPYNHFAVVRHSYGQPPAVALVKIGRQRLDLTEWPASITPITVSGGRCYGVGRGGVLAALDVKTGKMTAVADLPYNGAARWEGGGLSFLPSGEVREYDLRLRAWRTVATIEGAHGGKASPDRRWLAYFTWSGAGRPHNFFSQLHLVDLRTGATREIGKRVYVLPYPPVSSMGRFTPQFEWLDADHLALIRASGPAPDSLDMKAWPQGIAVMVEASTGTMHDLGSGFNDLVRLPFWSKPLVTGKGFYTVDVRSDELVPADLAVGDFRLVLGGGTWGNAEHLYYRNRLLAQTRGGLLGQLRATVSPDGRLVAWVEGERKTQLHCFDGRSGRAYQVALDLNMPMAPDTPINLWFTDDDLKPAPAPPLAAGWRRWEERAYRGD